jgi:hypothetical protein
MADSKVVKYIKDTLSQGYTEEQVREALFKQGWQKEEIDEAFAIAGPKKVTVSEPSTEPEAKGKPETSAQPATERSFSTGFVLSAAGGVLIIINSVLVLMNVGDILSLFISNFSISFLEMFDVSLSRFDTVLINVIIGGFLLGTSYIIYTMRDKSKITGMFMLALSLITIMVGNGFLVGGIIAIAGGIFAVINK